MLAVLMRDPLPREQRLEGSVLQTFGRLGAVLRNPTFRRFLLCMMMIQIPMMAYISSSSYIYENQFGLSSTQYSLYFAATALASVLGPVVYMWARRLNGYTVTFLIYGSCLVFGCLLFLFGHRMPALFALCFAPIMITSSVSRPFATAILLNLQRSDTGSASSLSNFSFTLSGTVGMLLITSLWSDYILGISILVVSAALVGGALCLRLRAKAGPSALSVFRGE